MTAKNLTWLAEVPRTVLTVKAPTVEDCLTLVKGEMANIVEDFATVEDISGKSVPDKKDAMMAKNECLFNKVANMFFVAKDIAAVTGLPTIQGLGSPDLVIGKDLFKELGGVIDEKGDYVSLNSFLTKELKKNKTAERITSLPEIDEED